MKFTVWDVGGQDKIRPLWRHYYSGTDAIIFVVDSADAQRFSDGNASALCELQKLLGDSDLRDAALLVFANKQDLPGAKSVNEISKRLELNRVRNRKWYIQGCCAPDGSGLYEGLDWLATTLSETSKY